MKWRRDRVEPKNVNKYLDKEIKREKIEFVKKDIEPRITHLLSTRPQDKLVKLEKKTSNLIRRIVSLNTELDEKIETLEAEGKSINTHKTLTNISKRNKELNEIEEVKKNRKSRFFKRNN